MTEIEGIAGLTVEGRGSERVVRFDGVVCPRINRWESEGLNYGNSYDGCITDSLETYQTPVGIVERRYWARGPGLEREGTEWRIVPQSEIEAAQKRFMAASRELEAAKAALVQLTGQAVPVPA